MSAMKIMRCVALRPNRSLTISVSRNVTENTNTPAEVVNKPMLPRSNEATLVASICDISTNATYSPTKRSELPSLRAYKLPSNVKLVTPMTQYAKRGISICNHYTIPIPMQQRVFYGSPEARKERGRYLFLLCSAQD